MAGGGWYWVMGDIFWQVVDGGGLWWIHVGWWWVVVDIFWLVVGDGGSWWVVA